MPSQRPGMDVLRLLRSGSTADSGASCEIPVQHAAIDRGELFQIGHRRALVDLVHGLADQAEFDHRAIIRDEARVRGAAAGVEFGRAAGDVADRGDDEIGERRRAW